MTRDPDMDSDQPVLTSGSIHFGAEDYFGPEVTAPKIDAGGQEEARMELARFVLNGLGVLAIFGIMAAFLYPPLMLVWGTDKSAVKELTAQSGVVLDFVKTSLPPIATLVIGYYFGQKVS